MAIFESENNMTNASFAAAYYRFGNHPSAYCALTYWFFVKMCPPAFFRRITRVPSAGSPPS